MIFFKVRKFGTKLWNAFYFIFQSELVNFNFNVFYYFTFTVSTIVQILLA